MHRPIALALLMVLGNSFTVAAQTALTLTDAIARAQEKNFDARVAGVAEREAAARLLQVRAGYLPRVDLVETWQRGDQPVFVFSSLLARRQFTAANFAIAALNHPEAVDNFKTAVTIDQPLFVPQTTAGVRAARIGRQIAEQAGILTRQNLAVAVTDAYGRVLIAMASKKAADAAREAAIADRELAGNRRDAGRATDADVLQMEVHLARVTEQQIRVEADERIARATLNQLMGEPLDATFTLEGAPEARTIAMPDRIALEGEALARRPDFRIAGLHAQQAVAAQDAARAAFLPQLGAQLGWELNGGTWHDRASSWVVGVVARVNLFQGFGDRARLTEAAEQVQRRALEREKTESAVRLDVRVALARLDEAKARETAGRAAADQARETRRITRDRYESGLTDAVSLLRAAEAVHDAELRQIAAHVDVVLTAARLDRALGNR